MEQSVESGKETSPSPPPKRSRPSKPLQQPLLQQKPPRKRSGCRSASRSRPSLRRWRRVRVSAASPCLHSQSLSLPPRVPLLAPWLPSRSSSRSRSSSDEARTIEVNALRGVDHAALCRNDVAQGQYRQQRQVGQCADGRKSPIVSRKRRPNRPRAFRNSPSCWKRLIAGQRRRPHLRRM